MHNDKLVYNIYIWVFFEIIFGEKVALTIPVDIYTVPKQYTRLFGINDNVTYPLWCHLIA